MQSTKKSLNVYKLTCQTDRDNEVFDTNLKFLVTVIEDDLEGMAFVGEKRSFTIELVEMDEAEFAVLPNFEGFES